MTGVANREAQTQRTWSQLMPTSTAKYALVATVATLAFLGAASLARADINDYEIQLVESDEILSVRVVHKPDGKPVPGAVIFATRLDMAPEGMATMGTPVEAIPSGEPGVYRFKANLTMQGGWQLSLGAQIQGEPAALKNELVLKAVP
jgi:hypothetical protein